MQDFRIGQAVEVRSLATVDYTDYKKGDRELIDQPLDTPLRAVIIGKVVKHLGTYIPGQQAGMWGDEYEQASLQITGVVTLWQIRTGMMNKPLLVRDEHLIPIKRFALPRMAPRPDYAQIEYVPAIEIAGLLTHDAR